MGHSPPPAKKEEEEQFWLSPLAKKPNRTGMSPTLTVKVRNKRVPNIIYDISRL